MEELLRAHHAQDQNHGVVHVHDHGLEASRLNMKEVDKARPQEKLGIKKGDLTIEFILYLPYLF